MKKLFSILFLFIGISYSGFSQVNPSNTYVEGYRKSNGTYVEGHYRTTPNSTINDNYTTKPNVNPYTGKPGTITPTTSTTTYTTPASTPTYKAPTYKAPTYKAPTYKAPKY